MAMLDRNRKRDFLKLLLAPAAHFCIRKMFSYADYIEAFKEVLIDVAAKEIARNNNKVTVSRLAVMTGVNRKEVTRIYKSRQPIDDRPSVIMRVIGQWESDNLFLTKTWKAKPLTISGENSEFQQLVELVTKNVGHKAVLFELQRAGMVEVIEGKAFLVQPREQIRENPDRAYEMLAQDVNNIVQAVQENIYEEQETRNHHNRTVYDNVYVEDVPKIRAWLFKEGRAFHSKVRNFIAKYDRDINPDPNKTAGAIVAFTSYSWSTKEYKQAENKEIITV
ncbi:MAG: hypothetical protein KDD66_14015 [Bdellovibrionales bacterium]|nr:hypothetical protein [Bdellovibrionales bacterium]